MIVEKEAEEAADRVSQFADSSDCLQNCVFWSMQSSLDLLRERVMTQVVSFLTSVVTFPSPTINKGVSVLDFSFPQRHSSSHQLGLPTYLCDRGLLSFFSLRLTSFHLHPLYRFISTAVILTLQDAKKKAREDRFGKVTAEDTKSVSTADDEKWVKPWAALVILARLLMMPILIFNVALMEIIVFIISNMTQLHHYFIYIQITEKERTVHDCQKTDWSWDGGETGEEGEAVWGCCLEPPFRCVDYFLMYEYINSKA